MIFSRKNDDRSEKSGETNAARKRKLARMEAVRSQMDEDETQTVSVNLFFMFVFQIVILLEKLNLFLLVTKILFGCTLAAFVHY